MSADEDMASRLAAVRHQLAYEAGPIPAWDQLPAEDRDHKIMEAQACLQAAHRAGLIPAAPEISPGRRLTATVCGVDGRPLERDEYAESLAGQAIRLPLIDRISLLAEGEAQAVAALLDELAGVYADEELGRLAGDLAVRMYDRLEI